MTLMRVHPFRSGHSFAAIGRLDRRLQRLYASRYHTVINLELHRVHETSIKICQTKVNHLCYVMIARRRGLKVFRATQTIV